MRNEIIKVTGMTCGGCASAVERALKAVPGVSEAKVSLPNHQATVEFNEGQTTHQQLKSAIEKAGYAVETVGIAGTASP